jgi:hypothetical protein
LEACSVGDGARHGWLPDGVGTRGYRVKISVSIHRPPRKTMWPLSRAKLCGR